ncbi:MAG: hypothetical protein ACE5JR_11795 [Gemmatimonadota bacterium]
MASTATLSTRIPRWLEEELRSVFQRQGEGPSEGLRRIVSEWWACRTFGAIEFRDALGGRRAALRDGPEIWEIISVQRDYGDDAEALRAHFSWIPAEALGQAVEYYRRFGDEVDALIAENERAEEYLRARGA